MKNWLIKLLKAIICARGVNAAFIVVCLAAAAGAPTAPVMIVSAGLYALLVWIG